jgi:hypothetical protein
MTDANARLRQRLRGICDHRIGEMIDAMIGELEWEARTRQPTLTDEERAAIAWYAGYGAGDHAKTLQALRERLG